MKVMPDSLSRLKNPSRRGRGSLTLRFRSEKKRGIEKIRMGGVKRLLSHTPSGTIRRGELQVVGKQTVV